MSTLEEKIIPEVRKYAVLLETNEEEMESWYYFIKYNDNEENLKYLNDQLKKIDFYIIEDCSTFDLELEFLVSETTAKEMTKIDMNAFSFHRKFDGKLKKIDFGFKKKDSNDRKIEKCFDILGKGLIEDFIDEEDIDEEDMVSISNSDEDSVESSNKSSGRSSNKSSDSSSEEDEKSKEKSKEESKEESKQIIPESLIIPKWAKKRKSEKSNK